jgi:hypothetical protein
MSTTPAGPVAAATDTLLSCLTGAGVTVVVGPPVDAADARTAKAEVAVWPLALLPEPAAPVAGLGFRVRYLVTAADPDRSAVGLDRALVALAGEGTLHPVPEPVPVGVWAALRVRPRVALQVDVAARVARPAPVPVRVSQPLRVVGAAMHTLRGQVLGPGAVPVPDVVVRAVGVDADTRTDHKGQFALAGLPARARLVVSGKGLHATADVAADADQPIVVHCEFQEV